MVTERELEMFIDFVESIGHIVDYDTITPSGVAELGIQKHRHDPYTDPWFFPIEAKASYLFDDYDLISTSDDYLEIKLG